MSSRSSERDVFEVQGHSLSKVPLSAHQLSKSYNTQRVVNNLSLECGSGETILLLGPNGAGKSTLLRILAGLARPDSGSVARASSAVVGVVSHYLMLYSRLTVRENLELFAKVGGASEEDITEALTSWQLTEIAGRPIRELSKGNQARAALARAALLSPDIFLLDEPSSNLDQRSVEILCAMLIRHRGRGASIIATHDIHRLRDVATRVLVMARGVIIADSGAQASFDAREAVIDRYVESNR